MWKRLAVIWALVKGDARLLWSAVRHPQAPAWLKLGTAAIVVYLVSPIDVIPDFIPLFGLVDDVVLVPLAIRFLLRHLPAHIRADIERRSAGRTDTPTRPSNVPLVERIDKPR
jgi:uncharacterized membrane protein YkvA (DUF1232 family)